MLALFLPTLGLELAPPSSVVVVGGSSGMGKALATSVVQRGGRVLIASRSASKLKAAATEILTETGCVDVTAVATYVVDASDEEEVAALADSLPLHEWDGLVVSAAGSAPHGPITKLPTADTEALFDLEQVDAKEIRARIHEDDMQCADVGAPEGQNT